nr:hypothetical protein [Tanacetum cinerariifolium]
MESLHLSFSRAVEAGIFTGIKIDSSLTLSHLFYADDAVFIGEWSNGNLIGIMNILRCFSFLSGMSINIHKSHLLGIGLSDVSVSEAANRIGCSVMKAPFRYLGIMAPFWYLGIMVGGNLSLVKEWDESIAKLKKKLSKWKLKTLSVGGRLTLLKAVLGSTPIYNMSLFKVPKQVLNSMERMPQGVDLLSHCKVRVGNGLRTSFWNDPWIGDTLLKHLFPWLYALEVSKQVSVTEKFTVSVTDRWFFDLNEDGRFCVKDVRCLLDDVFLPKAEVSTWNVAVASLLCPLCDSGMEDAAHLFFRCDMAKDMMFLIMMNAKGFYFFKFSTKKEVDDVLVNGPWMIHDVPMAAFTVDGLSAIASKIRTPIMLDSYTRTMCNESWGRNSYARAMEEIYADKERKETMVIVIPNLEDNGYTRETVTIEYEWKPPCCTQCKIFGHVIENCPHVTKGAAKKNVEIDNEGFQTVGNHGIGKKQNERVMGFKQKNFVYRPVSNVKSTTNTKKKVNEVEKSSTNTQNKVVSSRNQVLNETNDHFDEDDVENVYDETGSFLANVNKETKGASTPLKWFLMFSVASWNITGLNRAPKQKEVRQVINENHLQVCAILESHVDIAKLEKLERGYGGHYGYSQMNQVMHVLLLIKADQKAFYWSFVYAGNDYTHRCELSRNLCIHKQYVTDKPWVLMGDFNAALNIEDTFFGSSDINFSMREFRECVETIEVRDVNSTGLHYTWNKKPKADTTKVEWLCLGDTNSSYFHKMVKARVCRSRIEAVNDSNNVLQEGSNVPKTFDDHYINFLGVQGDTTPLNTNNLFSKKQSILKEADGKKGNIYGSR